MTREQFLETVKPTLRAKLKENEIIPNKAMVEHADRWAEAHKPKQGGSSKNRRLAQGVGARSKESKSRGSHKQPKGRGLPLFYLQPAGSQDSSMQEGQ